MRFGGNARRASLIIAACLTTAFAPPPDAELSEHDRAAMIHAIVRGTMLFDFDRAAWVATDDLIARLPKEREDELGPYIVIAQGDGQRAMFLANGPDHRLLYAADVKSGVLSNPILYPKDQGPELEGDALRMAKALAAARADLTRHSDWFMCGKDPFNHVVLPPGKDGTIPVYFLTPETKTDSIPFGGHYEIDVGADGQIVSSRAFTKGCMELSRKLPPDAPAGTKAAGAGLTHLLDDHPTEIHVFEQRRLGMPLFVMIARTGALWEINDRVFRLVRAPEKKKPDDSSPGSQE